MSRLIKLVGAFAVCSLLIAGAANAQTKYRSGSGGNISDAIYVNANDFLGLPRTNSFAFSTTGETIVNLDSIDLIGINHGYMGDCTMALTHVKSGTSAVFYNMFRFLTGENSDLAGDYSFTDRSGAANIATAAASIDHISAPPSGEYEAFDSDGNGKKTYTGSYRYKITSFEAFDGLTMNTDWRLDIIDNALSYYGSITDWGMTITSAPSAVPEPGEWAAMGVLGFGLVGLVVRGRRRLTN